MERESFVFYRSFYNSLKNLSVEDRDALSMAMYEYALNGVEPQLDGYLLSMFDLIRPQIDANNKRYSDGCKGGEFGVLGGRPKKNWNNSQKPHQNPTKTPNDNVNDNVNDNDNDNVNDNVKSSSGSASSDASPKKEKIDRKKKNVYDIQSILHTDCVTQNDIDSIDEARDAYKEMRKKIKKPLTNYAEKLRANDLIKLGKTVEERIAILNQSTASGWQDLYEIKQKQIPMSNTPRVPGHMLH